jgi:hypothetical protein
MKPKLVYDRIKQLKKRDGIETRINSHLVAIDYLNECFELNEEEDKFQVINNGMSMNEKFICYAGQCVLPHISLSARDPKEVIEAWTWFVTQCDLDVDEFTNLIERTSLLSYIFGRTPYSIPFKIIGLTVDLYRLNSVGVDTAPKIRKLKRDIRSHMKKAEKQVTSLIQSEKIVPLLNFLEDIASETHLGILAKRVGYNDIELGESPDLLVHGVKIEVKHPNVNTKSAICRNIDRGLSKAQVVAIDHLKFERKWLDSYNAENILGEQALEYALKSAINMAKRNKKCILFFGNKFENMKFGYVGRLVILS